ncbi:hypothetical protein E2C01_065860 [Portunus trituberculatus]|uniref:Uncharacterized protein n=1 Tax=Portunus trituberculatus TaxID=210409 RepID=A0A5B7HGP9_PORTR|nr:hypothetical protein [Portunus trituberculatus]
MWVSALWMYGISSMGEGICTSESVGKTLLTTQSVHGSNNSTRP